MSTLQESGEADQRILADLDCGAFTPLLFFLKGADGQKEKQAKQERHACSPILIRLPRPRRPASAAMH